MISVETKNIEFFDTTFQSVDLFFICRHQNSLNLQISELSERKLLFYVKLRGFVKRAVQAKIPAQFRLQKHGKYGLKYMALRIFHKRCMHIILIVHGCLCRCYRL